MAEENLDQELQEDIPEIPEDWAYPKVFESSLTLNDGTNLKGYVQKSTFSNRIWVFIQDKGYSYARIMSLFMNPEKTKIIHYSLMPSEQIDYIGYTNLATINAESDGTFNVGLTKPEV